MGQLLKAAKGEINITNFEGRIRLRWSYEGQRYSLNLPYPYCHENMHHATVKVAEIKLDMLKCSFDTTLVKYKPPKAKKRTPTLPQNVVKSDIIYIGELVGKFNIWVAQIRNINIDHSFDYLYTRKLLEKWNGDKIESLPAKMAAEVWADTTYNRRLNYLRSFLDWVLASGSISVNPLTHVSKRRGSKKDKTERRKPLTIDEIAQILDAIKSDKYCPNASRFKHSFYYPFLKYIYNTGVRNAEAIGLRVKHLNFEEKQIEVSEAFPRTVKGSNHAARIRMETKTGKTRYLPMTEELYELLLPLSVNKDADTFVFLSPKELSINDQMFERRILKPVMVKLGLGNRDLYTARPSFGTRAVQQGMAVTDVAYLMGHSTIQTTIRNYVGVQKKAIKLPRM